jgi:hypothetical protein
MPSSDAGDSVHRRLTKYKSFEAANGRSRYWTEKGARLGVYHLKPCAGAPTAWLVEGEPDVWTMWQADMRAFSLTGGAGKITPAIAAQIARAQIGSIIIVGDHDHTGREGAQKVAAALRAAIPETGSRTRIEIRELPSDVGPGGDVTTLYGNVGHDDQAFRDALDALAPCDISDQSDEKGQSEEPSVPTGAVFVRASAVTPTTVDWLWHRRIPLRKLSLISGDPGLGKSTLLLDLAARVSTGTPMPDGAPVESGGVVILSAEDGEADTIVPRLIAAGADLARINILRGVRTERGVADVILPDHLPALREAVEDVEASLVIVDPFSAYLPGEVNSWRDADVRRALRPLSTFAESLGAARSIWRPVIQTMRAGSCSLW